MYIIIDRSIYLVKKYGAYNVKSRKKTDAKSRIVDRFDLPKDLMLGAMNVSITGQYEAYIENYSSIIEYTDCVIKIRGKGVSLKITGKNLVIDSYSKDDMNIKGIIREIIYY